MKMIKNKEDIFDVEVGISIALDSIHDNIEYISRTLKFLKRNPHRELILKTFNEYLKIMELKTNQMVRIINLNFKNYV